MSKNSEKKKRVKERWESLYKDINDLFESLEFESFSEWKNLIEGEIIRLIKKRNVLSWMGREWKVYSSLNIKDNTFTFDVKTVKSYFRVLKIEI